MAVRIIGCRLAVSSGFGADLGGEHDLAFADDGLGVVALHPTARGLEVARVGVGDVDLARRLRAERIGLDVVARADHPPRPVAGDPGRMPGGMLGDDVAFECPVLFQPSLALDQAFVAVARDRLGLRGALGLQRLFGLAQHLATIAARAQTLGELVAARLAEQLVLGRVDARRLLQDLLRDLLIAARRVMRRRRGDLRAVHRDDADLDQAAARAERQHLAEQLRDRRLMANPEPRDRRVIRRVVRRDHAEGDVVAAAPLDRPRGPDTDRVGVDEQRHHHRRIVRRPTPTIIAITRIERRQVHLADGVEHEPREVALGQPLAQARRQQQLLLAITRDEVLRHHRMVLTTADRPGVCATPSAESSTHMPTSECRSQAWLRVSPAAFARSACEERDSIGVVESPEARFYPSDRSEYWLAAVARLDPDGASRRRFRRSSAWYLLDLVARKSNYITRVRSAVTGRFVKRSRAKTSPRTTVTARFRRSPRKKKR